MTRDNGSPRIRPFARTKPLDDALRSVNNASGGRSQNVFISAASGRPVLTTPASHRGPSSPLPHASAEMSRTHSCPVQVPVQAQAPTNRSPPFRPRVSPPPLPGCPYLIRSQGPTLMMPVIRIQTRVAVTSRTPASNRGPGFPLRSGRAGEPPRRSRTSWTVLPARASPRRCRD